MGKSKSAKSGEIGIGLMGLGVVGSGVAQVLISKADLLCNRAGSTLTVRKVLVRDLVKPRSFKVPAGLLTTLPEEVVAHPGIDIVIEVMGGESPAHELITEALMQGKHVVTANKVVMGVHGPEVLKLAAQKKVALLYEASVGGAIPLLSTLDEDLTANSVHGITAIINGTTNYILTRMAQEGLDFEKALAQASELGYAEPDPSDDIQGTDAAHKLAVMASLAFQADVRSSDVYREGISRLTARDFQYAKELGYAIKLLAIGKSDNAAVQVRVHPSLLPEELLLAKVDGVFNAIQVDADVAGRLILYGRGAGPFPTASAVISDVVKIARRIASGHANGWISPTIRQKKIQPMEEIVTQFYLRFTVEDTYGVLAQITRIFGETRISIASVIQKRVDERAKTAEIVMMTHPAPEKAMREALSRMERLAVVREIGNVVRVEA